jgi:hypothetical protein
VELQKIRDHPGIMGNSPLDALAHLGLARACALQARISQEANGKVNSEKCSSAVIQLSPEMLASARKAYQDFFALWNDADPDIPRSQTSSNRASETGDDGQPLIFGRRSSASQSWSTK